MTRLMTAKEARALSDKAVDGNVGKIDDAYKSLMEEVEKAAVQGDCSIRPRFFGFGLSHEQDKALRTRVCDAGFVITQHPDPDHGYGMSFGAYETLDW